MAETRIDKLRDANVALLACIKLMLTTPGNLNGRSLGEFLVNDSEKTYQPPIEQVCCGQKYVGSSCPLCGPRIGGRDE